MMIFVKFPIVIIPLLVTLSIGTLHMSNLTEKPSKSNLSNPSRVEPKRTEKRLRGSLKPIKSTPIIKEGRLLTLGYSFTTLTGNSWVVTFTSGSLANYAIKLQSQSVILDVSGYELPGCSKCMVIQRVNNGKSFLKKF